MSSEFSVTHDELVNNNKKASMEVEQSLAMFLPLMVKTGLLEFWQSALPTDSSVYRLLELGNQEVTRDGVTPSWQVLRQHLELLKNREDGSPLGRLSRDFQLTSAQLFTLALLGEVEASHDVSLAITELQQPDTAPRPSLHFLQALLEHLFNDGPSLNVSVLDIVEQYLVIEKLIALEGDGPLPQRRLSLDPCCWSALCGRNTRWPGSRVLNDDISTDFIDEGEVEHSLSFFSQEPSLHDHGKTLILRGTPGIGRRQYAVAVAEQLHAKAIEIEFSQWQEQDAFAIVCRYANWLPIVKPNVEPGKALALPERRFQSNLVVILSTDGAVVANHSIDVDLTLPNKAQRESTWRTLLNNQELAANLASGALIGQELISNIATMAKAIADQQNQILNSEHIALARQKHGAEKLRLLAQPVERKVTAESLVMPSLVQETLDTIILRSHQRESLCTGLGCTLEATANPGLRALFVGESGTGKTLAASYISTVLHAPLYRVDLSAVMNKYIGESEKNLSQLLDYAAANDVVLLFDEADALFGSRSEGKETGERFANMLTNFLLTRIETHPGIVILTTNSSDRIDNAFNRRIDIVVDFPLPGYIERLALWNSHLGKSGPHQDAIKTIASYCDLAGGQIRNAVLTAAVFAQGDQISSEHLWQGLRSEYNKIGSELPSKLNFLRMSRSAA